MLIGALVCIRLIVRDLEEYVIATRNLSIVENLEPVIAETLAASYATVFSKELRLQHIILKGGVLSMVNAFNFTSRSFCSFGQLMKDK